MKNNRALPDVAGAISGVVFCLLLFLAVASVDPLKEASDAEVAAWWSDSGNLRDNVVSMYFMLASVPFFLLFLSTLRGRLLLAEDRTAPGSTFVFAAGLCFAAALIVAGCARGMIAQSVRYGDEPLPGPDTLRTVTLLARQIFVLGAIPAAAITIAGASWVIVRTRALSAWLAWIGFAVAVVVLALIPFSVAPFALPLILLWVIAASVELWRTYPSSVATADPRRTTETHTPEPASAR